MGGHATGATLPKTGESDASGSQMSLAGIVALLAAIALMKKKKDAAKRETD